MDRSFLYTVVALLTLANGFVYIQKNNPDFLHEILGTKSTDGWRKDDPGWERDKQFPRDTTPTPPVTPPQEQPRTEPTPPQPQPDNRQPRQEPRQQPRQQPRQCPPG